MPRIVVFAALCLALAPALARAAEADSTASPVRANSLRNGAWALQFAAQGGLDYAGVFLKRHFAANHALRLGAVISLRTRSGDVAVDTSSVATGKGTIEDDVFLVDVSLVAQRYTAVAAVAHVYYGVGPFFQYHEYRNEQRDPQPSGRTWTAVRDEEWYRVGAVALLGGEWFPSAALSLAIEYPVSFGYSAETSESSGGYMGYTIERRVQDSDGWFVNAGNGVRLALGIYF